MYLSESYELIKYKSQKLHHNLEINSCKINENPSNLLLAHLSGVASTSHDVPVSSSNELEKEDVYLKQVDPGKKRKLFNPTDIKQMRKSASEIFLSNKAHIRKLAYAPEKSYQQKKQRSTL